MNFHIITLFPQAFDSYLGESILARAIEDKKIRVKFYNPRDFSDNKFKHIDQKPYSGGPGMVVQAEPVLLLWDLHLIALVQLQKQLKMLHYSLIPLQVKIDMTEQRLHKNLQYFLMQ